ncbi:MAG: integrase [Dethiosulfovibrio peptidovorans]|nr:MAG: integrase [Dethiosulfovibrio peptidovorans]
MTSFKSTFQDFFQYLRLELGLSQNTSQAYRVDLEQWTEFCLDRGNDPMVPSPILYDGFISHLRSLGLAPASIQRKCAAMRTWSCFLVLEGYLSAPPTLPELPSQPERLPKLLTEGEMLRLFRTCEGERLTYLDLRDRAVLEVLYGCGLRASELCALRIQDIRGPGSLAILGKGGKERMVPLVGSSRHWLERYIREGRPLVEKGVSNVIFLSRRGYPLRREALWRMIRSRGKTASIPTSRLHPHVIRHTVASHLLRRGMDLRTLQEFLGHKSIGTTEKYLHFDQELRDVYDRSHPRA